MQTSRQSVGQPETAIEETVRTRVAKRGTTATLPKAPRERYGNREWDDLSLLDLGGIFVLNPALCGIDELAESISEVLQHEGESLEPMLQVLCQERNRAGERRYSSTQGLPRFQRSVHRGALGQRGRPVDSEARRGWPECGFNPTAEDKAPTRAVRPSRILYCLR
jgi:hypothetical protein